MQLPDLHLGRPITRGVRKLSEAHQGATDDAQRQRRSSYAELTCLSWRERTLHAVAVNPRHELVMS
jgi:hypothetical protein